MIETVLQDFRFGFRMLRKSPGFTAVAIMTLALGVGANTAVFSIVNAVLLRPMPLKDSRRILSVTTKTPMFPLFDLGNSWIAFQEIRSQAPSIEECAAYNAADRTMTGQGSPTMLGVTGVSDGFFEELGATAEQGRLLSPEDQKQGHEMVAVLSDALWRTRFGADASVIGRTLVLDGKAYTVVGVAARNFSFPEKNDIWIPAAVTGEMAQQPTYFTFQMLAKLRPGRKIERFNAELATIAQRLTSQYPDMRGGITFNAKPLLETRVQNTRTAYLVLLGASSLVLVIACANLASLLLARGSGRHREMAVRAALGASRARLLRQGMIESSLIAVGGAAIGAFLASAGVDLFRSIAPANTPRLSEISVDSTLLLWSLAAALVAGVMFGLAPARRAARTDPNESLKEGSGVSQGAGRTSRQLRVGHALVVVEIALAFILLIGSALMTQTVYNLLHQNPGFKTEHLLTLDLPSPRTYDEPDDAAIQRSLERLKKTIATVASVPGVESVAASDHGVLAGMSLMHSRLDVEGVDPEKVQKKRANARYISPDYFKLLGVPLLRGRAFTERDSKGAPEVLLVNETMARAYWGTLDVVGKRISLEQDKKGQPVWDEVVGVVADMRDVRIAVAPPPEYYLSLFQSGTSGGMQLIVRTAADPDTLSATISREIWAAFPEQPVTDVTTMSRTISKSVGDERMRSMLLVVFAAIGFSLALIGAYSVVSYSVARRIPEIGIRMALGATPREVLRMVLRQGIVLAAMGVAIGAAAAFALTRVIASELYGVKPADPKTFVLAAVVMLGVACLACCIPARRAMRVDPMVALHYE